MRRSHLVAVAVIALLVAPAPAHAAKKKKKPKPPPPICFLVKDATGDAGIQGNAGGSHTYDASLDIVSMDIAVDATRLTGVIRVKDLTETSTTGTTGRTWSISMSNGTSTLGLAAYWSPLGEEQFNTKSGVFDTVKDEIRIHAKLADFPNAEIKKGSVLRGFYVTSNVVVGFDPSLNAGYAFAPFTSADATPATTASFPVGAASCVKVGV